MKNIEHVFFDLDHTLWDYDRNAQETLTEIYHQLEKSSNLSLKKFIKTFYRVNDRFWNEYNRGLINRDDIKRNRFVEFFDQVGVSTTLANESSEYFVANCSTKPHLMPYAKAVLDYLKKKYSLHIITNGFNDIQPIKLKSSGIQDFFDVIVTSESSEYRKPSAGIFEYAIEAAKTTKEQSVMIGDNPKADIHGANSFGMKSILFDPSGSRRSLADYSIKSLHELIGIL